MDDARKGKASAAPRGERLKAALRENLRRRKAQARGRRLSDASDQNPAAGSAVRQPRHDADK